MNDSNQIMDSLSSESKGRRKKLPIILILLALVLGVIIWRFKNVSPPATVPAPQDTVAVSVTPVAAPEPAPAAPKVEEPAPVAIDPVEPVAVEKPRPVKPKRVHAKPAEEKVAEAKPAAPVVAPATAPKPEVKPEPKPEPKVVVKEETPIPKSEPKVEPKPEVKLEAKPESKAVAKVEAPAPKVETKVDKVETPKPEPKPVVKAEAPTPPIEAAKVEKKFVMEDQPMPEKAVLSDESKLAFNTLPKAVESKSDAVAAAPTTSDAFKKGVEAYHKQDYENAIKLFGQLPKPTTKQRGNATRDQYVEGNFLLGVSLLKSDRAAEAVNAFTAVLDYEKYYPLANLNLGICYVELKQYFKANKAFEAVTRDQGSIDPVVFDDVMQRTKYFWALAWTRMYKTSKDADKQAYYQQQASMRWKDYQTWFGKNEKYRSENRKAEDYIKSLSAM